MKSYRILIPCSVLILCGLVDWGHSYPAVGVQWPLEESIAKNALEHDKCGEAKTAFADVDSGAKVHPPQNFDSFDKGAEPTGKTQKNAGDNRDFESLAGNDARGSQNLKDSQPTTLVKEDNQPFFGKVRTFFSTWPTKFWEKIKHWFSKLNFFKSKDEKVTNPAKDAKGIQPQEAPAPTRSYSKGADPIPSEVSDGGSPPQPPKDSQGGSKVASLSVKPKNPPNAMPRPAPAREGKSNINFQEGERASSAAPASRGPPRKQSARSDPSAATDNSKVLTITKPTSQSNNVNPNTQLIVSQTSKDTTPSHSLTSHAIQRHSQQQLQNIERNNQETALALGNPKSEKPVFQSLQASYQVIPHGQDGSGTEVASIQTQKIEVVKDPVTNQPAIRISAGISQSVVHGGPGHLQRLAALDGGAGNPVPTHAIEAQEGFLKEAGRKNIAWDGPSSKTTPKDVPNMTPIFGTGNPFTPGRKKPMDQDFQANWEPTPVVPSAASKVQIEEIEDDPIHFQEPVKVVNPNAMKFKKNLDPTSGSK